MALQDPFLTAILTTVSYTDQFAFPLKEDEIWQRLVVTTVPSLVSEAKPKKSRQTPSQAPKKLQFKNTLSKKLLAQKLKSLLKTGKLETAKGYYFLPGREKVVRVREQRAAWSKEKWIEVQDCIKAMTWIPWLKAIFVTGSLAMNNTVKDDDLDFMLISQPRRLWLTRILVTLTAIFYGRRRSWQGEEKNSWCFNLWLDQNNLSLSPNQRAIYQAYEVIQAVPVFGQASDVEHFYSENTWVSEWLPNWSRPTPKKAKSVASSPIGPNFGVVWDAVDMLAYKLQRWYMKPHQTIEKVEYGLAFFHPRNTAELVTKGWRAALQRSSQQKRLK